MTILNDLANIDLSTILQARLDISASVGDDGFKVAVSGDLDAVAFGDLNDLANQLKAIDPTDLEKTWTQLLAPILENIRLEQFPVTKLIEELKKGLEMGGSLLRQFASDPLSIGPQLGLPLTDVIQQFQNTAKNVVNVPLDEVQGVRQIWDDIQKGFPADPLELAEYALDLLLPFPVSSLGTMRGELNRLLLDSKNPLFDLSLVNPLRSALAEIKLHAEAGNQAELDLALSGYGQKFAAFQADLNAACQNLPAKIRAFNLPSLRNPAEALFELAKTGKPHGLRFIDDLKKHLQHFENLIAMADEAKAQEILNKIHGYLDSLEAYLKTVYLDRIDQGIEFLKSWVRELFAPLKLRDLQREIDLFFDKVVDSINEADIGQYAEVLRKPFKELGDKLDSLDIGQHLDQTLADVASKIDAVMSTIQSQMTVIDDALNGLTSQIQDVFQKIEDLLKEFGKAIEAVNGEIENLDIEGVTDEVIKALQDLRQKGEELLAQAPIPEPMKPLINQLISELEKMDLENLIKDPARDALATLDIPAPIKATLQNAMPKVQELLSNVHPDKLLAELQAELAGHLQSIIDLATKSFTDVIDKFFDELKKGMDVLDPNQFVDLLRIPYQKILDVFDNISPEKLLKPVTDAYDSFLADLPLTDPVKAAKATQSTIGSAGKAVGEAAAAPVKAAASPGKIREWKPDEKILNPEVPELKPGDIIRQLLGKPLFKLREAIENLDQAASGKFMDKYRGLTMGLAEDLREVRAKLSGLQGHIEVAGDDLLIHLADAEFEASYAVQSQIRLGNLSISTDAEILASANSTQLFSELGIALDAHRDMIAEAVNEQLDGWGEALEGIADLLETHPVSLLSESAQALISAVDPEPVAAALDSLANAATGKFIELSDLLDSEIRRLWNRIQQMIHQYNPALHLQRLREVMAVFWEEMALLNPHFWVGEIQPIHQAIRDSLAAYDPAHWTADLVAVIDGLKTKLTSIDPTSLLDPNQLNPFQAQANGAAAIDFSSVGKDLKTALNGLGDGLAELDPASLLDTVENLKERMLDQLDPVIDAIHQELITLLKSLKYVSGSASASVSVQV